MARSIAAALPNLGRKPLLSVKEVALKYNASTRWVWRQTSDPSFPQPFKLSPKITRWHEEEVDAHIRRLSDAR